MPRETGFYWVRHLEWGTVEIALWDCGRWTFVGADEDVPDEHIQVLSERLTPPVENVQ